MSGDHDDIHHGAPADPMLRRLQDDAHGGCAEARALLSRRAMLGITAGLFTSAWLPPGRAFANDPPGDEPRFLLVILRGGMDGLNALVPYADSDYQTRRSGLAIQQSDVLSMPQQPGFPVFGFNPAMTNLRDWFDTGDASFVQAVGLPLQTRSHFDCQDNLENGLPGLSSGSNATGWMNRLLSQLPTDGTIRQRGALAVSQVPLILRGPAPFLGWSMNALKAPPTAVSDRARQIYKARDAAMHTALLRGEAAHKIAVTSQAQAFVDNAFIKNSALTLRRSFQGAGRLLGHAEGPRVAVISVENFDTHAKQGLLDDTIYGALSERLLELDTGLGLFRDELGDAWANTVVLCVTEFGRSLPANGKGKAEDAGTDHGIGSLAILAGGAVAGGKVHGDWPGLASGNLVDDADLRATTDMRSIFKGVLSDHLKVSDAALEGSVFAGSDADAPRMKDLLKTPSAAAIANPAAPTMLADAAPAGMTIADYRALYA